MDLKEYILTCIGEEAGEVTQASSKCLRFGMIDFHPDNGMMPNGTSLIQEINDLIAVAELLGENNYLDTKLLNDFSAKQIKKEKFYKYLKYAEKCGCVQLDKQPWRDMYQPKAQEVYEFKNGVSVCKGDRRIGTSCGFCDKCKFYGWTK
jgi:hypothetical protein